MELFYRIQQPPPSPGVLPWGVWEGVPGYRSARHPHRLWSWPTGVFQSAVSWVSQMPSWQTLIHFQHPHWFYTYLLHTLLVTILLVWNVLVMPQGKPGSLLTWPLSDSSYRSPPRTHTNIHRHLSPVDWLHFASYSYPSLSNFVMLLSHLEILITMKTLIR